MTSFAFILGVVPLVVAAGAGAEMRRSLGTAVFSGMLGVTLFGIFLTPVFFYVIQGLGETRLFTAVGHALGRLDAARGAGRAWESASCSRSSASFDCRWGLQVGGCRGMSWPPWLCSAFIGSIRHRSPAQRRARSSAIEQSGTPGGDRSAVISRFFIDRPIFAIGDLGRHRAGRAAWPCSRCRWRSIPR